MMPKLRFLPVVGVLLMMSATQVVAQDKPPASSQTPANKSGLSPSQRQILERLRNSGLSREQVRKRLTDAGYDPTLADRYFDELSQSADSTRAPVNNRYTRELPQPSGSLVAALRRIGVLLPEDSLLAMQPRPDTISTNRKIRQDSTSEPQIFGKELFVASTQFEPVLSGPVDLGYKLGPGDQLTLIITGDVELAYELEVTREGYIVIPDVGQVIVSGLTVPEAKRRLNDRLARVYSGIQVGSTAADITVGKVRTKLVYVIGEAEVPGAYSLSGSATVFSALYRAAGPARNGTFRRIEVRRNNRVIANVDIYDYLLKGDKGGDVLLEQGDVVFIPIVGPQVTVSGSVRRPAIFEMKDREGLQDVLRFAGGAEAEASVERVQIDRILPPGERRPGRERVLVDVPLAELARTNITVRDGDRIRISKISEARRNRVIVTGDVQRPGEYEYRRGMTALDLITNAQGLLPTAYTPAAQVLRVNQADSSTSLLHIRFDDPNDPNFASKVVLEDLDEVTIFGRAKMANPRRVSILGEVKAEGTYEYAVGMTVRDIVLLAGGFKEGALTTEAEVARQIRTESNKDSLAVVRRVPLDIQVDGAPRQTAVSDYQLAPGDQVFIRRTQGFAVLGTVEVLGQVAYPGAYTVTSRREHLSEIIARAGGVESDGYIRGLRLFRDGKPVGVNADKALRNPGSADDMVLETGDRIEVPRYDPTVLVTGAVAYETRVRYQPGLSLLDYVGRAGGATDAGNAHKANVRYPNGEVRTIHRNLFWTSEPKVEPGSTITVPARGERTGNIDQTLTRVLSLLSGLATIVLTVRALK